MVKNVDRSGAEIDLTQIVVRSSAVKELIKSINRKDYDNEERKGNNA